MEEIEYCYWMIWGMTFEGDRRWSMGRFFADTDSETACDIVRGTLCSGVGGEIAEVLEAEWGYDDDLWDDYSYLQYENRV